MKVTKVFPALFLLFSFGVAFSQVKFSIGPTIGFTGPVGDYSGTTFDYYNGTRYGLNGGINIGGVLKLNLGSVSGRLTVTYSSLSNSGGSEPGEEGYIEVGQNIVTFALGPEYAFKLAGSNVKPYIGLDFLLTSFSGEVTFIEVRRVEDRTYSMSGTTRAGIGLGGGVIFAFSKKYSLDIGLKYNMHNLLGKSFIVYATDGPRDFAYTSLNDAADPVYPDEINDHPIGDSRAISTIMINLAFLFDL